MLSQVLSIEKPYVLFLILVFFPAAAFVAWRVGKISRVLGLSSRGTNYQTAVVVRTVCRFMSWTMLVLSLAGISWGVRRVAVQKNGNAVSFVFDISYSMTATDCKDGASRLQAASSYAEMLLSHLEGVSFSVVLAKGDGVVAVPLTEDKMAVSAILPVLSPRLMTSVGTNLGSGVLAALRSFPDTTSRAKHIWIFTDGDETTETLSSAIQECLWRGISVAIIGFGGQQEVQVASGDGTPVMTQLKSLQMEHLAEHANSSFKSRSNLFGAESAKAQFVNSAESDSTSQLLKQIRTFRDVDVAPDVSVDVDSGIPVVYEMQSVPRYKLFLALALLFFMISFVASDFFSVRFVFLWHDKKRIHGAKHTHNETHTRETKRLSNVFSVLSIFLCCISFSSCGSNFSGAKKIFLGAWHYRQNEFQKSVAEFIDAGESDSDSNIKQYALYGLAMAYISEQENEAAFNRLSQISPDAPSSVLFSSLYARGVIAYRNANYEMAAEFFRDALKVDSTNVDAKINLEITMRHLDAHDARGAEQELLQTAQGNGANSDMEAAIFERVRESDIRRWKNSEQSETVSDKLDY